jgi:heparosan-N-sulfate-glucuronate 5-epimerase
MSQVGTRYTARHGAGFFSSASRLRLPPGERGGAGGYHLDLRAKAPPGGPPPPERFPPGSGPVGTAQAALGHHERWLAGEGDEHLEHALVLGAHLRRTQLRDPGPRFGGFPHDFAYRHGSLLRPGWLSAMAQGEAASLFVRLAHATADEEWAQAARDALAPLELPVERGGVSALLGGRPFPQEYPATPPSHVLNGGIFALWGLYDVGVGLDEPGSLARFDEGVDTLAERIGAWSLGWWSRYDLIRHRGLVNVASSFYQVLHVDQLEALVRLTGDPRLRDARELFSRQYASRTNRARAFSRKAAFRLVVPRHSISPEPRQDAA